MTPISLTVITRNAEAHVERCLKSVPFASDILVLDCGVKTARAKLLKNVALAS